MHVKAVRRLANAALTHWATVWVVLAATLLGTWLAWKVSSDAVMRRAADRFEFQAADLTQAIDKRLKEYEVVIRGGAGLVGASEIVDRDEWRNFVSELRLQEIFPGIQGLGFSKVVQPEELAAHVAKMRAEGMPDYMVRPDGERPVYTTIVYLEPLDFRNKRAIGYDMFSEPVRRAAMERARDTGEAAMSGMVTLVQETDTDVQKGFLIYVPTYRRGMPVETVEQRRLALTGYAYAPFRIRDLLRGILGSEHREVTFKLFDGPTPSKATLLYDNDPDEGLHFDNPEARTMFSSLRRISLGGHGWTLHVHSRPGYLSATEVEQPWLVAVGGIVIDLLLFVTILSLSRQRARAQALAETMTADLWMKNQEMEEFTNVLAHHLQEPARLQHSFSQRLAKLLPPPLPPEAEQALRFVMDASLRQRALLRDVRLYLSLDRLSPPAQPCSSEAALDMAMDRAEEKIVAAGAVIERGPLPPVYMEAVRLADVFAVVLENAVSYRHADRQPRVVIAAERRGAEALFSVTDNGIGIAPDYRLRVFRVFERLDPGHSGPGTGIGLALAKKIVEAARGRIWIEDAPAGGTRVCFTVPLGS